MRSRCSASSSSSRCSAPRRTSARNCGATANPRPPTSSAAASAPAPSDDEAQIITRRSGAQLPQMHASQASAVGLPGARTPQVAAHREYRAGRADRPRRAPAAATASIKRRNTGMSVTFRPPRVPVARAASSPDASMASNSNSAAGGTAILAAPNASNATAGAAAASEPRHRPGAVRASILRSKATRRLRRRPSRCAASASSP